MTALETVVAAVIGIGGPLGILRASGTSAPIGDDPHAWEVDDADQA